MFYLPYLDSLYRINEIKNLDCLFFKPYFKWQPQIIFCYPSFLQEYLCKFVVFRLTLVAIEF